MSFDLIVLDFDGTALNSHHQLTEITKSTLRELSSKGVCISFATGRSSLSVVGYLKDLAVPQESVPVICFNGSVCMSVAQNGETRVIFSNPIKASAARVVIDFAQSCGQLVQYYDGVSGEVYAVPRTETHVKLLRRYAALVGRDQVYLESYDEVLATIDPAKILVLTENPEALIQAAKEKIPEGLFHIVLGSGQAGTPFFVEFLNPGSDKGSALVSLAASMNIPLGRVAAFGDGYNDIEMLTCGCHGIAMKNASEVVRAAADHVTEFTNDEDGVARHIESMRASGLIIP